MEEQAGMQMRVWLWLWTDTVPGFHQLCSILLLAGALETTLPTFLRFIQDRIPSSVHEMPEEVLGAYCQGEAMKVSA